MKCADIPDTPILQFLADHCGPTKWGTWFDPKTGSMPSVRDAMPPGLPDKLVLAKMKKLVARGLVNGCGCGCRGDFYLSDKGAAALAAGKSAP